MAPLGLPHLAGNLVQAGHHVEILSIVQRFGLPVDEEAYWNRIEEIKSYLARQSYDVLGISILTGDAYAVGLDIAEASRSVHNGAWVIVGGYHASATWQDILTECPAVAAVVIGEGDVTAVELTDALAHGASLAQIRGIAFRQDDRVVRTEPRPLSARLDDLPLPAYHTVDYLDRYDVLSVLGSRGCPFHCNFCAEQTITHGIWRNYRSDRVIEAITKGLKHVKANSVMFEDPLFGFKRKPRRELLQELLQQTAPRGIKWGAEIRVGLFDVEDFALARQAGARSFLFGLESGSPEMLRIMNKTDDPQRYLQAVVEQARILKDLNIAVQYSFVLGYPGETFKTAVETIHLAQALINVAPDRTRAMFQIYVPYPGTASYHNMPAYTDRYGTKVVDMKWWKNRPRTLAIHPGSHVSPSTEMSHGDLETVWRKACDATAVDGVNQEILGWLAEMPKGKLITYSDLADLATAYLGREPV
jgi:anaerobic magnesium-protoporphyrin IX monomethyl ester cyclase